MQKGSPTEASVAGDARMERVTGAIMAGALRFGAADVYDALTTLNELKGRARVELAKADFLLVPSAAHHYTVAGKSAGCNLSLQYALSFQRTGLARC